MKKNKLSNAPSQNTSPVPYRKSYNDTTSGERQNLFASDPDITVTIASVPVAAPAAAASDALSKSAYLAPGRSTDNDYETIDKRRSRSNSYDTKDPGYETIPASKGNVGQTAPSVDLVDSFDKSKPTAVAGIYTTS